MWGLANGRALGDALTALKDRSGQIFEALSKRLSASKSSLHRYAPGETIPTSWSMVKMWARECGATNAEARRVGTPASSRGQLEVSTRPPPHITRFWRAGRGYGPQIGRCSAAHATWRS
ncbi:helix-turn-helix transcriptional regulator [Actinoplanes sp. NPDC023801]|uniref:helix-turn-helix domain-containing protein n=1 Tax=Actinoplanes sp. NPDC023801 TaxID=3154595 RepID=UPI0033D9BA6C